MKSGKRALEKKGLELFSIRRVCALICRLLEKYLSCSTERIFCTVRWIFLPDIFCIWTKKTWQYKYASDGKLSETLKAIVGWNCDDIRLSCHSRGLAYQYPLSPRALETVKSSNRMTHLFKSMPFTLFFFFLTERRSNVYKNQGLVKVKRQNKCSWKLCHNHQAV